MKSLSHCAMVNMSCMFPLQRVATFCTDLVTFTILHLKLTRMYFFHVSSHLSCAARIFNSGCGLNNSLYLN